MSLIWLSESFDRPSCHRCSWPQGRRQHPTEERGEWARRAGAWASLSGGTLRGRPQGLAILHDPQRLGHCLGADFEDPGNSRGTAAWMHPVAETCDPRPPLQPGRPALRHCPCGRGRSHPDRFCPRTRQACPGRQLPPRPQSSPYKSAPTTSLSWALSFSEGPGVRCKGG